MVLRLLGIAVAELYALGWLYRLFEPTTYRTRAIGGRLEDFDFDLEMCTDEQLQAHRSSATLACNIFAGLLTDYRNGLESLNREWGKRAAVKFHAGL